jgi:multidrug efflux pump subunit AcrA (membrane-fusion protein)
MATEDLSKLKIDRSAQSAQVKRKKRSLYITVIAILVVLILFVFITGVFSPAVNIEITNVVRTYPSQAFTILNASGYVVPQRKSSVAAKVTGRLIALYVEEGSKITKNQVIAQLENEDLLASRRQAAANLDVSGAIYEQAKAD